MFLSKKPDKRDAGYPAYRSTLHASIIAILGLLIVALDLIDNVYLNWSPFELIVDFVYGFSFLSLLFADVFRHPLGFVPFLLVQGIVLIVFCSIIFNVLVRMLFAGEIYVLDPQPEDPNATKLSDNTVAALTFVGIMIVCEVVGFYCWVVVQKAWRDVNLFRYHQAELRVRDAAEHSGFSDV